MSEKKVLVVDEAADLRSALCGMFAGMGYAADGVSDGMEGLARATKDGYDLIVLDTGLTDGDHVGVLRKIRRERPETPLIALVDCTSVRDSLALASVASCECITKPFDAKTVVTAAERVLEKHKLTDEIRRLRRLLEDSFRPGPLRDAEKVHIEKVLVWCNWNQTRAAGILDVDRKTLRNKIKEFKLRKPEPVR